MRLLIVGNLEGYLAEASRLAHGQGVKIVSVRNIDDALKIMRSGKGADLAIIDVNQPIARFYRQLEQERIVLPLVACGLDSVSAEQASDAILQGAREFLPLPADPQLIATILQSVSHEQSDIIHRDPLTAKIIATAEQIAPSEASVLITGESGSGKEVYAHYIHKRSKRAGGPFIAVNCAAIPETLLESEMFGHERGAFSGAVAQRLGKFEEADQGTLLLDEISEMDLRLQAKLLRVLQEREITRLGGSGSVGVNVRVLATSNRDLEQSVAKGEFRQDLYFRLNVVNLDLPPLRQRRMDIDVLADYFVTKFAKINGYQVKPLSAEARQALQSHPWPGNVRELENTIHRALLLATGSEIDIDSLRLPKVKTASPPQMIARDTKPQAGSAGPLVGETLMGFERRILQDTMQHCLGNENATAAILGVTLRQLQSKLAEHGLGSDGSASAPSSLS